MEYREYPKYPLKMNKVMFICDDNTTNFLMFYSNLTLRKLFPVLRYCNTLLSIASHKEFISTCYAQYLLCGRGNFISLSYAIKPNNFLSLITSFDMTYLKNDIKMAIVW